MSSSVAFGCMFCPPVSYAFATSAYWPIAIVPSSCSAAAPICRPSLRCHPPPPPQPTAVNPAIAAPCVRWRFFLPYNFLLGCPTPLSPRTLHDHRRPAHPHEPSPLPHSLGPNQTCAYCSIPLSQMLVRLPNPTHSSSLFPSVHYPGLRSQRLVPQLFPHPQLHNPIQNT